MNEPIFESVWDALRFSFYMEAIPAGVPSSTWTAIKSMMKNSGKVFDRVQSRVHMKGLTPLEVRGQCAMVRDCVEENLLKPEIYSIWACHGVDMRLGKGVQGLAEYFKDKTLIQGDGLQLLIASLYTKVDSLRQIAQQQQISRTSLREDFGKIKIAVQTIEKIAHLRLEEPMYRGNLVVAEYVIV